MIEETARVVKRAVDLGTVRVSKVVRETEEEIDTTTIDEEIEIEHVARNTWLKKPAKPRREGDTLIIPVMEEVTVVEKRILLREELYLRKKKVKKPGKERVVLRKEEVIVEDGRRKK